MLTREQVTLKSTFLYVNDDKPWLTGRKVEITSIADPGDKPDFVVRLTNGSGMTGFANLEDLAETPEAVDRGEADCPFDPIEEIRSLEEQVAALKVELDGLYSIIIQPWDRDGEGHPLLYKVNLAWWDTAISDEEARRMIGECIDRQRQRTKVFGGTKGGLPQSNASTPTSESA